MADPFRDNTFTASASRLDRLTRVLLSHVPSAAEVRVLDLGCGTGGQLFGLLSQYPNASFVGVDISKNNIAAAMDDPRYSEFQPRVSFRAADFFDVDMGLYDVIVADSVLQNIDIQDDVVAAKLSRSLRPGGLMLMTLPCDSFYNRSLWRARRIARCMRTPLLDRVLLWGGRIMHPDWDVEMIRERVPYMYLLPVRIDEPGFRVVLTERMALVRIVDLKLPRESLAQPSHILSVYRRLGG